jgi:hypothetical protein
MNFLSINTIPVEAMFSLYRAITSSSTILKEVVGKIFEVETIVTYWGLYLRWMFISIQKLNKLQLIAISNSPKRCRTPHSSL